MSVRHVLYMNLIRNLVGLIIAVLMLPICVESFSYVINYDCDYDKTNDEIALSQLREQLLFAYDIKVYSDEMDFIYQGKDYRLSNVNGKMILQPGTQIYINNIDNLLFNEKNGCIYVTYERDNKEYERILSKKQGLYIDDFSYCDVDNDEPDSDEE